MSENTVLEANRAAGESTKTRPRREFVMRAIQPLARRTVALLARTPVEPWQIVVAHALIGLLAAALVATDNPGAWIFAALLLQLKTLLDNVDGGLARATGRVTELGRYLDTGLDLIVNLALFIALTAHGPAWLAALAFVVLTFALSYDFNAERLYLEAREPASAAVPKSVPGPTAGRPSLALLAFRGLYRLVLAPQDRVLEALEKRLFRLAGGGNYAVAATEPKRAWSDLLSTAALVNLGLSSQFVAFGICLIVGRPYAYVYLVLLQGVYVVLVQCLRVSNFRRHCGQRRTAQEQP